MRPERPFSTHVVVTSTKQLQAICRELDALVPVAAAEAGRIGRTAERLETLVAAGLGAIARAEEHERWASPGARGHYRHWADRLRQSANRVRGASPPLMESLRKLLKQMQSQEKNKKLYKDLTVALQKDPGYRKPADAVLRGESLTSVVAVLAVILVLLKRKR